MLSEFVGERLPGYMVPSAIVVLESLPLTPAGKLDRNALPAPVFGAHSADIVRPRTVTEEILLGIFRDVLGLPDLSVDTSFFELGGNSLMATQVVSRANTALGVRIGVRDLFQSPSVSQLAVAVANTSPQPDRGRCSKRGNDPTACRCPSRSNACGSSTSSTRHRPPTTCRSR